VWAARSWLGRTDPARLEQGDLLLHRQHPRPRISPAAGSGPASAPNTSRTKPSACSSSETHPLADGFGAVFPTLVFSVIGANRAAAPTAYLTAGSTRWCAGCGCPLAAGLRQASLHHAENIRPGLRESDPAAPPTQPEPGQGPLRRPGARASRRQRDDTGPVASAAGAGCPPPVLACSSGGCLIEALIKGAAIEG